MKVINMSIEIKIKKIISDQFSSYEKIENNFNFKNDVESDKSELIMDIEDEFDIFIEEDDFVKKVETVDDMINYVKNLLGEEEERKEWEEIYSRFEILDIR